MPTIQWKKLWGYEVTKTASTGVYKMKDGRWLLFAKVNQRLVTRVLHEGSQKDAETERLVMISEKLGTRPNSKPKFGVFATSLYAQKVTSQELKSASSIERWDSALKLHLIPAFGLLHLDEVTLLKIEEWRNEKAKLVKANQLSAVTVNGWLSILRIILRSAVVRHDLPRDHTLGLKDLPTEDPYTEEDPNALLPHQQVEFIRAMRRLFPQFYAFTYLGFATGLRPSTLRAFRRKGPLVDVLWDESLLRVRRSNSRGQSVLETNKNGGRYRLPLPPSVMTVLEEHVAELKGRRAESDLLFPSKHATFQSRSALDKPFIEVSRAIGLGFILTPRGMRRTFQDIARSAGVEKKVRKAVCGHASDEASDIYETVSQDEMRAAVARVAAQLEGRAASKESSAA